ncbi:thioredoxin-like negative regulator of GroEL [Flavobacterium sp. 28A]|uniref:tetratricopeptide repeat protein n=1 Tax=Flavobacterium sp. 28A TaxID=2735895 RepID=UPI00156F198C|nr:tetratricopeptide repeat protein [Flavobacterium sp. 28A]NRT15997.1 thioredoxin-like negative regulator of GroEL [Flavobacterium sp. 28A]
MKFVYKITLSIFFIFSLSMNAQDMKKGFTQLEKGDFANAEVFFKDILKEYPENKTARLCYARAIGLNNKANEALDNFIQLKKEYPGDLEIELNYAEALLWNKKFDEAKVFYSELVKKNPTNFVAHLGFANTLSNLKEYPDALLNVNKALMLSPGNSGALISRKYIKLGYAYQNVNEKKFIEAETYYDEILVDFPLDKETLMNKANMYLITKEIKKGKDVYNLLQPEHPVIALNGLSLLEHIDKKEKNALKLATTSLEKSQSITDESLKKQTQERYVQALIWNKKYKEAASVIEELKVTYPNENWVLSLAATLAIYKSNFPESITHYEQILKNDSKSFDGNLGIANAYKASGEISLAYQAANTTLEIFNNQGDALNFIKKIKEDYTPYVEQKFSYSFDNGDNTAIASHTEINLPLSTKWAINSTYQFRKTDNKVTKANAESNDFLLGATYQFHPKISYAFEVGVNSANSSTTDYNQLLIHTYFKIKPLKLQDLEVGYKREMQNFNSDLIDKEIATNNYYFNYNLSTNFNFGWFTQYFFTSQTDNNNRNLLFTSFYYNFMSSPVLKGGLNYQYIAFKNRVPTDYFSPKKFNAVELFLEVLKDEKIVEAKSWFYNASLATGYQFIEDDSKQWTYRIQGKLGYKFSDRLLSNLYVTRSNIASTTASGFTFNEFGLRIKWNLTSQPIFKLK